MGNWDDWEEQKKRMMESAQEIKLPAVEIDMVAVSKAKAEVIKKKEDEEARVHREVQEQLQADLDILKNAVVKAL